MKIAIVSDNHFGKRKFRKMTGSMNTYEYLNYKYNDEFADDIISSNVDLLLIAGDFFDTANPTTIALENAQLFLDKITRNGIEVIMVGGNHDYSSRNHILGVHPFDRLKMDGVHLSYQNYEVITKEKDGEQVHVVALPWHQPELNQDTMKVDEALMNQLWVDIINDIRKLKGKVILLTHGVVEEMISNNWSKTGEGNEVSEATKINNMILPKILTDKFDYVIIGHIHSPFNLLKQKDDSYKKQMVISPGATIINDKNQFNLDILNKTDMTQIKTGPLYLHTQSKISMSAIERHEIKTIEYIESEIYDSNQLNNLLLEVSQMKQPHIWKIRYHGNMEEMDQEMYQKARDHSLNFLIQLEGETETANHLVSVRDFWEWLDNRKPEYREEFQQMVKGESKIGDN